MSTVPTQFPIGYGPLDLVAVVRTQLQASIAVNKATLVVLRAKYGPAVAETSFEGQAIAALAQAVALAEMLLPLL
jgi:hypothetical protein